MLIMYAVISVMINSYSAIIYFWNFLTEMLTSLKVPTVGWFVFKKAFWQEIKDIVLCSVFHAEVQLFFGCFYLKKKTCEALYYDVPLKMEEFVW